MRIILLSLFLSLATATIAQTNPGNVGEGKPCDWEGESYNLEAHNPQHRRIIYTFVCQYNSYGKLVWHHVSTATG